MTFKIWVGRMFSAYEEIIRILSMILVLSPAAYVLPRKWALWTANALSLLLVISPMSGMKVYSDMRHAFGKGRLGSLDLTRRWLGQPFRDFVIQKRVLINREDITKRRIIERNAGAVKTLRESGEPYIMATGHFLREVILGMFSPNIIYGHPILVSLDVPERIRNLNDLRIRIQFGTLLKNNFCWGREIELVFVGKYPFKNLISRLRERGNVVFIHVDAIWHADRPGSYLRPFAGHKSRVFATGVARLARLAQCQVVTCVHWMESDGTLALEWGTPIRPPHHEKDDDIKVMNELIDGMEVAIGKRPTQYVLPVGGDRRWNPGKQSWEDLPE